MSIYMLRLFTISSFLALSSCNTATQTGIDIDGGHELFTLKQDDLYSTSRRIAEAGRNTWLAYRCMIFASKSLKPEESEILSNYAENESLLFFLGIKHYTVLPNDNLDLIPVEMRRSVLTSNTDFNRGVAYARATESALDSINLELEHTKSKDTKKEAAQKLYDLCDCEKLIEQINNANQSVLTTPVSAPR